MLLRRLQRLQLRLVASPLCRKCMTIAPRISFRAKASLNICKYSSLRLAPGGAHNRRRAGPPLQAPPPMTT
jgi:hypothetical protein